MGYFDDLIEGVGPVEKVLEYNGKSKPVFFRRITALERVKLARGQKVSVGDGKGTTELDLGELAANRHMLVLFATITEDGKQVFNGLPEVQKLPDDLVGKLAVLAQEANDDEGNA